MKKQLLLFSLLLLISGAIYAQMGTGPQLDVEPKSLVGFSYFGLGPSEEQSFIISGSGLSEAITIHETEHYEISVTPGVDFHAVESITLYPNDAGELADTSIFVRLQGNLNIGVYNNEFIIINSEEIGDTVTCSGNVRPPEPYFDPVGNIYYKPQTVEIRCDDLCEHIFFITEPGTGSWTEYTGEINVNDTMTIWAYVTKDIINSDTARADYIIKKPELSVNTDTLNGFNYSVGSGPSDAQNFIVWGQELPDSVIVKAKDYYEIRKTDNPNYSNELKLPVVEETLSETSIFVRLKSDLDAGEYQETIEVTCGDFVDTVRITLNGTVLDNVAMPTFEPEGGNFNGPQDVTIQCETPDAEIHYTLFGGEPTQDSTLYVDAISIIRNTTIKAKAWKNGISSQMNSAEYDITYHINVSATEGGTVSVSGNGAFHYDDSCTVTATPGTGYEFVNWTEDGDMVSINQSYTFPVTGNRNLVANFQKRTFTITASANPTNGGSVSGGGNYRYGETCHLHASPHTGYAFNEWKENGSMVSNNQNYSFVVTGNRTLVATFTLTQPNEYSISVSAKPDYGGNVSGGGTYSQGASCTVTATPNTGFQFVNWTENSNTVSNDPSYSFEVNNDRELVAHFEQLFTITVTAHPEVGGDVYIETQGVNTAYYTSGQPCTVHARKNENYIFINWTNGEDEFSNKPDTTITVSGNLDLVANFKRLYTITVNTNPEEGGSVTGGGTYLEGTEVTLVATENEGYSFIKWQDDNTENPRTIIVQGDFSYMAFFEPIEYEITLRANPEEGGTVTGGGTFPYGQEITVSAQENPGYRFVNWTDENNSQLESKPDYTFRVESDIILVANFADADDYIVYVEIDPPGSGTATGAGGYKPGETCTLTATAKPSYNFLNWTNSEGIVNENTSFSFSVQKQEEYYVAHFQIKSYTITATANPPEGGTVDGDGTYNHGTICKLTALPKSGYTFDNWTEDGIVVHSEAEYSFTVTSAHNLVANFKQNQQYTITATPDPEEGGTVTGAGNFAYNVEANLHAIANEGYTFDCWMEYGAVVSKENPFIFQVTSDRELVAHFTQNQYTITALANPNEGGSISGGGTYAHGTTISLMATANNGFEFQRWDDGNTDNPRSITVTSDATFTAIFTPLLFEITTTVSPEGTGTVEGGGTYAYGATATLTAIPTTSYVFDHWNDGNTENPRNITVTATMEFVAFFETIPCIEDLQTIVPKYHHTGNDSIILLLVYPNPADDDYRYQWYKDDVEIPGAKNQYYYKKGGLDDGVYTVKLSLGDNCSRFSDPYLVSQSRRLILYPNPSRQGNNILVENDCAGPAQLAIYSTDGRLLHLQTVNESQTVITIQLAQGVYMAYLTNSNGYTKVGKLVIH